MSRKVLGPASALITLWKGRRQQKEGQKCGIPVQEGHPRGQVGTPLTAPPLMATTTPAVLHTAQERAQEDRTALLHHLAAILLLLLQAAVRSIFSIRDYIFHGIELIYSANSKHVTGVLS
ncbi:uncharacterized protein LOC118857162 isoform X2 [Trichosurus vulpecula]|uniref:uncharacterized protein LOC118857162 isoform X2 n=1 Tax=Trichosurus vulpecula TaxID=9337 RepID=UPI00186B0A4E|nr:uncharacterized protein LOC118857162 isoform X2 [Trichosurus vulpecula]